MKKAPPKKLGCREVEIYLASAMVLLEPVNPGELSERKIQENDLVIVYVNKDQMKAVKVNSKHIFQNKYVIFIAILLFSAH